VNAPDRRSREWYRRSRRGEAGEAHRAGLDGAVQRSVGVLFAHRARDDELVVIFTPSLKKCLGRFEQWKQTALSGCRRSCLFQSSSAEGVSLARVSAYMESVPSTSTSHAEGIRFSLIIDITVQGTMPRYSSIEVQHWPGDGELAGFHPVVDHGAQLGHLHQRGFGVEPTGMYFLMAASLACAASSLSACARCGPSLRRGRASRR